MGMGGLPTDGMQTGVSDPAQPDADSKTGIRRGIPVVDESRKNLVGRWASRVRAGKLHWDKRFKRMREDQQVAREGATKEWVANDDYTVPIIARHINQQVAKLYAKNPTMVAKPKDKLRFKVWDGSQQQMQMAEQSMQLAVQQTAVTGMEPEIDPQSMAIIADIQEGKAQMEMLRRMCKTAEILWKYYTSEQKPNFKQQMKQLVRRTKVNGVGFVWLSYQRLMEKKPDIAARIEDITGKIASVERMQSDLIDNITQDDSPTVEELRTNLADLQNDLMMIAREGPVFDFPRSTEIIIDPKCRHLRGFVGGRWIAREFHMDLDEVEETYKIDLRGAYTPLRPTDNTSQQTNPRPDSSNVNDNQDYKNSDEACVWEVYDKKNRQMFTIIDGYIDFATEPKTPEVDLEGFWPCHALTFNDIEDENELYPPSDVYLLRHPQREHNRARQGLREHRIANRPAYAIPPGSLSQEDKVKLANRPAHAVLELTAMGDGTKTEDILSALKPAPIDPALYDTKPSLEDIQLSVGAQQADIGGTSGSTATESSIAESNHNTGVGSNVDDLDEFLGDISRDVVQIMLLKVAPETAQKIAGPGAVWPDLDREQVIEELEMEIKAGSSGRPNQSAKLANMERAWPALQMLPGVNPEPIIREMANLLDINVEELYAEGMPSITAINAAFSKAQQAAQVSSDDPQQQGDQGGANEEQPNNNEPGPQPGYTQPQAGYAQVINYDASGNPM